MKVLLWGSLLGDPPGSVFDPLHVCIFWESMMSSDWIHQENIQWVIKMSIEVKKANVPLVNSKLPLSSYSVFLNSTRQSIVWYTAFFIFIIGYSGNPPEYKLMVPWNCIAGFDCTIQHFLVWRKWQWDSIVNCNGNGKYHCSYSLARTRTH